MFSKNSSEIISSIIFKSNKKLQREEFLYTSQQYLKIQPYVSILRVARSLASKKQERKKK